MPVITGDPWMFIVPLCRMPLPFWLFPVPFPVIVPPLTLSVPKLQIAPPAAIMATLLLMVPPRISAEEPLLT